MQYSITMCKYSIRTNQKGGIALEISVPKVPKDQKVKKEIVHQLPHRPKVRQNVLIALIRNKLNGHILSVHVRLHFLLTVFNITRAPKGDKRVYQTFCWDDCRDATVKIVYNGDADLYANQGSPPRIKNNNCGDCLCKSRSASSPDQCIVTTMGMLALHVRSCMIIFK